MKELTLDAVVDNITKVTEFVDGQLEELGCPMKAQMQIDIAIDELFSNIAHYAYNPEVGPATVRVEVVEDPMAVVVTFVDSGVQYEKKHGWDLLSVQGRTEYPQDQKEYLGGGNGKQDLGILQKNGLEADACHGSRQYLSRYGHQHF